MSDHTTAPTSEIGCPHDFGATVECPFCGASRSTTTNEWVTRRYNEDHPDDPNAGYSWPPERAALASQPEPAVTEVLRPDEIRDIDMALRYSLIDHDLGCDAIGMDNNCTCPARGHFDRARTTVKRIGAPFRKPSGDYDLGGES